MSQQQQSENTVWLAKLAALGVNVSPEARDRSRALLAGLPEVTDEEHAENLRWLEARSR